MTNNPEKNLKKLGKRSVSFRIDEIDFHKLKAITKRLRARESDVFRFAIKLTLDKLALLGDENLKGVDVMPIFVECGSDMAVHFNLDSTRIEHIINYDLEDDSRRVDDEDIGLLAMSAMPERYLSRKLKTLIDEPVTTRATEGHDNHGSDADVRRHIGRHQVIELAREHNLIILADEIYDKILYDGTLHTSVASLADDVLFLTYNGLSKTYRAAGYRSGWMIISGAKHRARDLIEGIEMLSNMRLCANVPAQLAIQTSLGGYQSINDLTTPGGRLYEQREVAWRMLNDIPGVSCVKPQGALYLFPRLDPKFFPVVNDEKLVLDLLLQEKILLVQGSAFNVEDKQHLRVVFLPRQDTLADAMTRLGNFLEHYRQ